jgi:CRISPR-associated protein Csx1
MASRMAISVWGDPERWREVSYEIDGKIYDNQRNSTHVIGKHFDAAISVFIPISIVDACGMGRPPEDQVKMAYQHVKQYFPSEDFEIMIAPSVGIFKIGENVINFKGKLDLFKIFSFYKLFKIFDKIDDNLEIYADLTYGINYMTMANYEAIKLAFSLYCALRDKKGKIVAMNSDPFTAGNKPVSIKINVVETLNFDREIGVDYIAGELRRKFDINKFKWSKITGNDNDKTNVDTNEVKALFMAMDGFGAFLPCLVRNDQMQLFMKYVNSTMESFSNSVLSEFDYSKDVYSYRSSLNEGVIVIFSALKILTIDLFTNSGNTAPLKKLKILKETKLARKMAMYLFNEEIKKIGKLGDSIGDGKPVLLGDLMGKYPAKKPCGSNNRILIAHCALEMNITYIKKENDEILLGYGECLDGLIRKLEGL